MNDMNPGKANKAKIENIIDMAVRFSAMMRVFEDGSADKIKDRLESILPEIASAGSERDFRDRHHSFCQWFAQNVKTAERKKRGSIVKGSVFASYGQGAKVLDIVLKVFVYYCQLPDPETANRTRKWLNAAIDTKMLGYLRKRQDTASPVRATTIEKIDVRTYATLQGLVRRDISHSSFPVSILPVQWGDIMWRRLNRGE